ncbi:MAG TPA: DUF1967 domain-containing protein, partial [Armatimonadetes bacterium]|nr:DUF1967 domain-containing protein [Armatimonadota bacterium]
AARPKIADYPFTTLVPNLGTVRVDHFSFVVADVPGLIEGAHRGAGLGHNFLKHIERCHLLLHLLDMSGSEGRDPLRDFKIINDELRLFNPKLAQRTQLVVANKMDLPGALENLKRCEPVLQAQGFEVYPISAVTGDGIPQLIRRVAELLKATLPHEDERIFEERDKLMIPEALQRSRPLHVEKVADGLFCVTGDNAERITYMLDMHNLEARREAERRLERVGVFKLLRRAGAKPGDRVQIGDEIIELDANLLGGARR